jgi:hypothetical protein
MARRGRLGGPRQGVRQEGRDGIAYDGAHSHRAYALRAQGHVHRGGRRGGSYWRGRGKLGQTCARCLGALARSPRPGIAGAATIEERFLEGPLLTG